MLIRSGSTVLVTQKLDNSGRAGHHRRHPPRGRSRPTSVSRWSFATFRRQECAPLNDRMTFALDAHSTVTVTPGTNNRGGFPVLPMAFTPDFDVALDNPGYIRFAAQAINLMAQQTSVTLRPKVTTFARRPDPHRVAGRHQRCRPGQGRHERTAGSHGGRALRSTAGAPPTSTSTVRSARSRRSPTMTERYWPSPPLAIGLWSTHDSTTSAHCRTAGHRSPVTSSPRVSAHKTVNLTVREGGR